MSDELNQTKVTRAKEILSQPSVTLSIKIFLMALLIVTFFLAGFYLMA